MSSHRITALAGLAMSFILSACGPAAAPGADIEEISSNTLPLAAAPAATAAQPSTPPT